MSHIPELAFMPHPPVIIPEIGDGRQLKAQNTIEGMKNIAKLVGEIKPEVILFISPHGNMFRNGVSFLYEDEVSGDFSDFGNDKITFTKKIDKNLTQLIGSLMDDKDLVNIFLDHTLAGIYNCKVTLDHGVLVPLYFIDQVYSDYEIVHITPGFLPLDEIYTIGNVIKIALSNIDKRCMIVASGDLSHCLSNQGPYEYNPMGELFDDIVVSSFKKNEVINLITMDEEIYEQAGQCALRSYIMAYGALDEHILDSLIFSYEAPFGVGYLTGFITASPEHIPSLQNRINISEEEKYERLMSLEDEYIKLARAAIVHYVNTGEKLDINKVKNDYSNRFLDYVLNTKKSTFVSLHKFGHLRGCMGTISPTSDCLADEIIYNAIQSSVDDPRFNPVTASELKVLEIKVDILHDMEKIASKSELNIKKYGVLVKKGLKRGVLLPNLKEVQSVDEQVDIAMKKAGIHTIEGTELYRFEVERHEI
jgi:AmmeMemoRadiSam system protein A